jgi:hypothetical protein
VVPREVNVGDLVLKRTSAPEISISSHRPGKDLFVIVEEVAIGAYVLAEVDGGMLTNT